MITWIRENAVLFSLAGGAVICISTLAVNRYQLSSLLAAQPITHQHINDTTRHIDQRDLDEIKELKDRIDRLERRLERTQRYQLWMANGIRQGNTSSVPVLIGNPPLNP